MGTHDIQPGTRALMILKTLDVLGPLHGYGVARLTPAGRSQHAREAREWQQTADLIAAFFAPRAPA